MTRTLPFLLLAGGMVVSGCATEAGLGTGGFNEAVVANHRVQVAYADPSQRLRDLSVAFRAAVDDTVTFDFDSARLGPEARRALDQQAMWLKANEGVRMSVVGHTDLVGGEVYNQRLGMRRARAAVSYLVSRGVDRSRLDAVESRGMMEPVVPTDERERRNRRAVTMVAGFDRNFIGTGLDGVYAQRVFGNVLGGQPGANTPVASGVLLGDSVDTGG